MYWFFLDSLINLYKRCSCRILVFLFKNKRYFKIATTETEKTKIYQFRYNIYYRDLGRNVPGLNHEQQLIVDELDAAEHTVQFYQGHIDNPRVVMRCIIWQHGHLAPEVKRKFDLEQYPWIDRLIVAEFGRLMANTSTAKHVDTFKFIISILRYLESHYHVNLLIVNCKPGLVKHYALFGLRPYTRTYIEYPDGVEIPLAGFLDKTYAQSIHSPLSALVTDHPEVKAEYCVALFKNASLLVLDKNAITPLVRKCPGLHNYASSHEIRNILELCIYHGAFIMIASKEFIKICHKNMVESGIYFLLEGQAYIKQGNDYHPIANNFIAPCNNRWHADIYCHDATILVLKKSCLHNLQCKNPCEYNKLMYYIKPSGYAYNALH